MMHCIVCQDVHAWRASLRANLLQCRRDAADDTYVVDDVLDSLVKCGMPAKPSLSAAIDAAAAGHRPGTRVRARLLAPL
jgi:hypothetical protein